jgi:predicted enzyme related to lactoylglutathione lyase
VVGVAHDTDYWPSGQHGVISYTVPDLDAMLTQLREAGVRVDENIHVIEGIGRFGWAADPEGNRFELWEPSSA